MKMRRFEKQLRQELDTSSSVEVIVDRTTGVQYLFYKDDGASGLTVLLRPDGQPLIKDI